MKLVKHSVGSAKMSILAALIVGLAGGVLISNYTILGETLDLRSINEKPAEKEILYWVAPMDPAFRRDGPGKSPMGMDLVPVYADANGKARIATKGPACAGLFPIGY